LEKSKAERQTDRKTERKTNRIIHGVGEKKIGNKSIIGV
jgi:hypothetical protein